MGFEPLRHILHSIAFVNPSCVCDRIYISCSNKGKFDDDDDDDDERSCSGVIVHLLCSYVSINTERLGFGFEEYLGSSTYFTAAIKVNRDYL